MIRRDELESKFNEYLKTIAQKMKMPEPDAAKLVKEILLGQEDVFVRSRRPVIAVTGVTHTGKSSIINALFDEKHLTQGLLKVGQTTDTTDLIMRVQFKSGLLIYDTPGGGGSETFENLTRAFLKLPQLKTDVFDRPVRQVENIVAANADTYNPHTNGPRQLLHPDDFEKIDLIIFVVSVEAGLKRDDVSFFKDVASSKVPVIVVVNKIDLADQEKVHANLHQILTNLNRKAVPVSANTGQGLDKLAVAIQHSLPLETSRVLGETVDNSYKKILRDREIDVESVIAGIKTAFLVDSNNGKIVDTVEYTTQILALYGIIISQYSFSEKLLKEKGLEFGDVWNNIEKVSNTLPSKSSIAVPLTIAGLAWGAIVATLATGGLAAIPLGIGAISGGSIGTAVGIFSGIIRRSQSLERVVEKEFSKLKPIVSSASRLDTAIGVISFGRALRRYCDILEQRRGSVNDFSNIYKKELAFVTEKLFPYSKEIDHLTEKNEERIIRQLAGTLLETNNI